MLGAHVADSLSLVPYMPERGLLLDIGSGGGFPAIPLKIVRPGLDVVLVERSSKKVGFLRKVIGALGLKGVKLVEGEFPVCCRDLRPDVVTARAVERGNKVLRQIAKFLPERARFLCQSGDPEGKLGEMFHVEHVEDGWSWQGLRRGELYIVTRKKG